jgi:transposase
MKVTLIGIDLAKNIFQVCGVNKAGKKVFNKAIKRNKLLSFLAHYPDAIIAMEACSGSNYWGRVLEENYKVLLIPPQHVKPFVKGNKNDRNDAFAITEAAGRPDMQFVRPRTLEQTDMILVHRLRTRLVEQRVALINQLRGFLNEYGIVLPAGKEMLLVNLPQVIEEAENGLTSAARQVIEGMRVEWLMLNSQIKEQDRAISLQAAKSEAAKRLMEIKGVAEKTSTAIVAHIGDGKAYGNGRHFAANLGLVPKEHSSGGKQKLSGITKRGNEYIRRLLVQGAWSVLRYADKSDDRISVWALQVAERRGKQKAVVAVANKLARICWSMIYHETEYKAA